MRSAASARRTTQSIRLAIQALTVIADCVRHICESLDTDLGQALTRDAWLQFVYVQLLQRKVSLDLTTVVWYKRLLTQAIFVAILLAFGLFVGTWFDTNGPTRGSTAAAFAALSSLLMVLLKQKTFLQQERTLVPLNYIMQARTNSVVI